MLNNLNGVSEFSLGGYGKKFVEKMLGDYTKEAKDQVIGLLLSCCWHIDIITRDYASLQELDSDSNYVSSDCIWSTDTEF